MKLVNKNIIILIFSVSALVFFGAIYFYLAENSSANVENNVSATANSGGNKIEGSGNITTGDAKAEVKAVNVMNGEGENSVKAEVKAEANGESAEANYEGSGPADIHEESADGSAEAEIKVENNIEGQPQSENESKSFFEKVWNFIASIF